MNDVETDADPTELLRSPLHDRHVAAGAKFSAFGGWSMPLEYAGGGVLAEHTVVRREVGIFDVSHLGKIEVHGLGAVSFVNRCLTNDLDRIGSGQAQYTLICADDGGVVDDLIAYRHGDEHVFLIPNAANTAAVAELLSAAAPDGVTVTDRHRDFVVLAVQGPRSDEVLRAAGLPTSAAYMGFVLAELPLLEGAPVTVCRTGYTGERGYELVAPSAVGAELWDALIGAGQPYGIRPAGLAARDTLRTEMGYPLHGQDIGPSITPVQARLGWAIGWAKDTFFGDAALRAEKEAGPASVLRGVKALGRGIPRPGMVVIDGEDRPIGTVTSGTFSPTLKSGVGLALVDARFADGDEVAVQVRQRRESFVLTKPPFVVTDVRG